MEQYVYQNITELKTPLGGFVLFSSDGMRLPFSVASNPMDYPSEVKDLDGNVIGAVQTDTNYQVEIDTSILDIGKEYSLLFTGDKFTEYDSDEHTFSRYLVKDKWAVGIGAYDPNDDEYISQLIDAQDVDSFVPDESGFRGYTYFRNESVNGFSFRLLDYSMNKIKFRIAWVDINQFAAITYRDIDLAMFHWLC